MDESKKIISRKEYEELWKKCQGNMMFGSPNIDPIEKEMTVRGISGKGCEFANEYDRRTHEHYNPPMPRFITMHTVDGIEYIYPERIK